MSITQQSLLDAMDGVAMLLDHELRIKQIGEPNWARFRNDNSPQDPGGLKRPAARVLGRPVTEFIAGDTVRATFADLFKSVLNGARSIVQLDFRCDAPALRRDMRLAVTPVKTDGQVRHLLYQSITLRVQQRPALPLFGTAVVDQYNDDILTLCAICARVAWPIGAPTGEREWIDPPEYYRRDGSDVALISHGFCEDCAARIQVED